MYSSSSPTEVAKETLPNEAAYYAQVVELEIWHMIVRVAPAATSTNSCCMIVDASFPIFALGQPG